MKKALALLIAAMMLLSLAPFALADDVVNIEFQFHKGETDAINAMTAAIDAFNAANPGIHVEMNTAGDTNSMVARSQQDDLPDIFACQTSATFEKMFAAGQLMDLTGQEFLNNIVEGTLALSMKSAMLHAAPVVMVMCWMTLSTSPPPMCGRTRGGSGN